jgi:polyisoprenoid-binding protein YceI
LKKIIFTLTLVLPLAFHSAPAGPNIDMSIGPSSRLLLKGTSTLHDYECATGVIKGNVEFNAGTNRFTTVDISIPVRSLHSESSSMDDNMYESLKADENPEIRFTYMQSDTSLDTDPAGTDSAQVLRGVLTVAGKEKAIDLKVNIDKKQNGGVWVKGKQKLLMTDFNVDPPTFMLGLLKTGNEVTVEFNIRLKDLKSAADAGTNN